MFLYFNMKSLVTTIILQLMICYAFGAYFENIETKRENLNKRLVSYTIVEKIVRTQHDCVRECFNFGGQCKAINYNIKRHACELKSKGSDDVTDVSEYEHAAGYIFTDITDWPALTLSKCPSHNCNEKQICIPYGNVAYRCMDKVDCGEVPVIEFATVTVWATTDGAVATYSCDFGYEFKGAISEVTCKGGSWTSEDPIACIPKDCGPLNDISYGTKTVTATTHGGIASYTCSYGYQLYSGDLMRTCVDGTWDGYEPYCQIKDCGQPAGVTYGSVYTTMTTHGETASYTCDAEYQITAGNAERICEDGVWVGTMPVCSPIPQVGCYINGHANLFAGTRRTTIYGRDCQRWDSQYPHVHDMTSSSMYPSGDVSANENYCRDPDNTGEPWCYTINSNVRWEVCGVSVC